MVCDSGCGRNPVLVSADGHIVFSFFVSVFGLQVSQEPIKRVSVFNEGVLKLSFTGANLKAVR